MEPCGARTRSDGYFTDGCVAARIADDRIDRPQGPRCVQISTNHYNARGDETCEVPAEDAKILLLMGWTKVADSGEEAA
jgi:hypothetical protein